MKIKPTTFFLVLAALLLGGVTVLVVQTQEPTSEQTEANESQPIFSFKEEQVKAFTLETESQFFKFERDGEGVWQMREPEQTPANDASIAFLLNLVATGQSTRSISIPDAERSDFGLDQPLATLELTLDNQETHTFIVGGYDFNRTSLYAIADPPENADGENADTALSVLLVSPNFENAVSRPMEEWQQLEATASPSPSSNSSPSPNASASPSTSPSSSPSPSAEASDSDSEESPSP